MKSISLTAILTVAVVVLGVESSFAFSEPVAVNTSQSQNRRWTTVLTNEVPLRWTWNENATSAELKILGMNTAFTTNFTEATTSYLWKAFSGNTPLTEDLYDLTLTFYNGSSEVVETLTSQLAVVKSAIGNTEVISTPESMPWPRISRNVVIPYDSGWLASNVAAEEGELTIARANNSMQETTVLDTPAGYFGWKVDRSSWGFGTFNLALSFTGIDGELNGTLVRIPQGTFIDIR